MVNLGPLSEINYMLDDKFYNNLASTHVEYYDLIHKIKLRIYFIVGKIYEIFNDKTYIDINISHILIKPFYDTNCCELCYDCESDHLDKMFYGLFSEIYTDSSIKIIKTNCGHRTFPIIFNGKQLSIGENFPKKWLFQDFEEELKQCKQEYIDYNIQRDLNKKEKKLNNKNEKAKMIEKLKNKLSKEELELISFKK